MNSQQMKFKQSITLEDMHYLIAHEDEWGTGPCMCSTCNPCSPMCCPCNGCTQLQMMTVYPTEGDYYPYILYLRHGEAVAKFIEEENSFNIVDYVNTLVTMITREHAQDFNQHS